MKTTNTSAAIEEWLSADVVPQCGRKERVRQFLREQTKEAYAKKDMTALPTLGDIVRELHIANDGCNNRVMKELGAKRICLGVRTVWALTGGDE